jgi:hypothetical protein
LMAITAVGLVAGVVAGLYFGFKSDSKVDAHSRTEREKRHDDEKIKNKPEKEYVVKNGRAQKRYRDDTHNASGKRLPDRMQNHSTSIEVTEHLKEQDMAMINLVAKNIYSCFFQYGDSASYAQISFLAGTYAVTCLHVGSKFAKAKGDLLLTQTFTHEGQTHSKRLKVPMPKVIPVPETELVFLDFGTSIHLHTDITQHLVTDADLELMLEYGFADPRMVFRDRNGDRQVAESTHAEVVVLTEAIFKEDRNAMYATYPAETSGGSSGGLTLTLSPVFPRKIVAVHSGAAVTTAYDAVLTLELFRSLCGPSKTVEIVPHLDLVANVEVVPPKDQTVPVGKLVHGHSSGGTNTIAPSPLSRHLQTDPEYPTFPSTLPTVMYNRPSREVYEQWTRAGMLAPREYVEKDLTPKATAYTVAPPFKHIDPDLLDLAYDPDDWPSIPGGAYHLLSPEEAVFGLPYLKIAPIDFTTSAGYNWNPQKMPVFNRYELFGLDKNNMKPTKFNQWHPELQAQILRFLQILADGNIPISVVVDALKAERRGVTRVLLGQTRLFYAGSIVHLIVSRMFLSHLTSVEKDAPTINVPAVGIVPTSREWAELYSRLARHPNKLVTDQVNYDMHNQLILSQRMGEDCGRCLAENQLSTRGISTVWNMANSRSLTKADFVHAVEAIHIMTCQAVHVDGTVAYIDAQTTVSGVDRTSQANSYRNKTSIRLVFIATMLDNQDLLTPADRLLTPVALFKKHVECALYGDDQVISMSDTVAKIFTPYNYAQLTEKLLGGKVTRPDKSPITPSDDFVGWSEVELLKRGFDKRDGVVFAPLQKKVIEDSLHWVHKPNTAHAIAADTVRSALLEAALHGRDYYDQIYGACRRACTKAGVKFEPLSYHKVLAFYTD